MNFKAGKVILPFLLFCSTVFGQNGNYNPEYHFYPSIDPTGLFYYAGQYYLNWGTAVSSDLVHWKMTPFGIERNKMTEGLFGKNKIENPFSEGSPFRDAVISIMSGTAVIDWNNTSGFGVNGQPPIVAVQGGLAYSNDSGKTWTRSDKPFVIENSSGTFRDPKVFWHEQTKKWIMVLPWSEIQEVRFFSSDNLSDWKFESKFGPWGAEGGQWECVDFFPLRVDNDPSKVKWVLVVSVQPRNGQYFIGDFDGKKFTMDESFRNDLSYKLYMPEGEMLFDFERGIDDWKNEGNAFINDPTVEEGINGKEGRRAVNSDPVGTGKITSPEFTITKKYIDFLVGGGYSPGKECVNLLVDGKIVRTQTGNSGNAHVNWAGWDVSEFAGKKARIEIVDNNNASNWMEKAYIYCDAIMLADNLPNPPYKEYNPGWEKAYWVDWGPDYYALRAWANYAPGEERTIWTGWMGSWLYINEPVLGNISIPRSLGLKTFPEGIRLVQNPVDELRTLRTTYKTADEYLFEGIWIPRKFTPTKNSYELIVEFENVSSEEFGIKLCVGANEQTVIGYKVASEELYVDRRNSGYDDFSPLFPAINTGPLKNRNNTVKLHIFVDKCSIEVFGNDGETVISSKIYPSSESLGIQLFSSRGEVKVKSLDLWDLSPIHLY